MITFARISLTVILSASGIALGQRGTTTHSPTDSNSPLRGIQGFFDTELTEPGKFAFDFPSFQVEYGINHRWSIGLNGLTALAMFTDKRTPSIGLKLRHSIHSTPSLRVTASGYFFQIPTIKMSNLIEEKSTEIFRFTLGSLNITRTIDTHELGFSSIYGWLSSSLMTEQSVNNSLSTAHSFSSALWWRWNANRQFGTELLGFVTPALAQSEDSPFAESKQTNFSLTGASFVRGILNWRASQQWLWSVGAVSLPNFSMLAIPYIGFAVLFPETTSDTGEE